MAWSTCLIRFEGFVSIHWERCVSHAPSSQHTFHRGADALPSVGAGVLLPTGEQLRAIVESGERRRVKIGSSPLASETDVYIDPDRLFGRHLAVLGNTGSGKSCSVAGLIRWSIEAASQVTGSRPNARFIVLDPNGEYAKAFDKEGMVSARVYKVDPEEGEVQLRVPLWFWNSDEWCSFAQASARAQRPTLLQALRFSRERTYRARRGPEPWYAPIPANNRGDNSHRAK